MIIEYNLDENDYLTHQLFIASNSQRIKKKRLRSRIIIPVIYVFFALLFSLDNKFSLTIIFFIVAVLWYFIYPVWEKRRYINHFKGFIKENYTGRFARNTTLEFQADYILAKENGSESKILTKEVEEITEIPTTILIRLKTGQSLILPKNRIHNADLLINRLKELANSLNAKYIVEDNWEWK